MGQQPGVVFTEHADVAPIYCSGVASAFVDGDNVHMTFYQEQVLGDGTRERLIVQRIIMPTKALMRGRELVDFEIAAAAKLTVRDVGTA